MLTNGSVQNVVKHSMAYGFVLSQPFSFYVDSYPVLQNEILTESRTLYYGENNEAVRVLQNKLNELSYFDSNVDGDFGVLTEYALKKFQRDQELESNGQADRKTVQALITMERKKYMEPLKSIDKTMYQGQQGKEVEIVQASLSYFGYYQSEIDGIYGPLTAKALKSFQQDYNLEITNEINEKTANKIYAADASTKQEEDHEHNVNVTNKAPKEVKKVTNQSGYQVDQLIADAKKFIGTPYLWGGETPNGFDCSGYLQYVFQLQNVQIPRTTSEQWNFGTTVQKPSVGDIVFFETYKPGPSHNGIYVGNGKFIHSGASRGVEISDMNNSYWSQRYLGAKRVSTQ
ncbi:NlpC/P60 family protein [Aquibacillus sp. 3ASR75-11]|uniref:NlpC/P60 family protein n=1 Tax=Terrihalobacillus insolitus TaxID=2950438 RepID=A0A9X3WSP2_9BACI|nr:NlpC/P60 family protein [Terrihalobacillus insolitus]MDC3412987.1 NlpC/P60 family protein [Terrihalobacillus insolitus]MDC3424740.1 NlpC/P60 family protein [Terrihalobacillus insolitus]